MEAHVVREVLDVITRGGHRLPVGSQDAVMPVHDWRVLNRDPPTIVLEALAGRRHVTPRVNQYALGAPRAVHPTCAELPYPSHRSLDGIGFG